MGISVGDTNPFEEAGVTPLVSVPAHDGTCASWVAVCTPKGTTPDGRLRVACQSKMGHDGQHEVSVEIHGNPVVLRWENQGGEKAMIMVVKIDETYGVVAELTLAEWIQRLSSVFFPTDEQTLVEEGYRAADQGDLTIPNADLFDLEKLKELGP